MSKWFVLVILVFSTSVFTQTPPNTSPTPVPTPNQDLERQRQLMERRERDNSMRRLDGVSASKAIRRPLPASVLHDIKTIYRGATSSERSMLSPDQADLNEYRSFLQQKNTGIARLVPGSECGDATKVISADPNCLKYTMPGNGSYFSFRRGDYSIGRLADLHFNDNSFSVAGLLKHGILTGIGDVRLQDVRAETPGIRFLLDFEPSKDMEAAKQTSRKLFSGIDKDGFYYRQELNLVDNMTYAIRMVAYRASMVRAFNGYVYDEAEFDRRIDVTVAFRVIRKHNDGSITLIWKQIDRKRSPELKQPDTEDMKVEVNKFIAAQSQQ